MWNRRLSSLLCLIQGSGLFRRCFEVYAAWTQNMSFIWVRTNDLDTRIKDHNVCAVPVPVVEYTAPVPMVTNAAPSPVMSVWCQLWWSNCIDPDPVVYAATDSTRQGKMALQLRLCPRCSWNQLRLLQLRLL